MTQGGRPRRSEEQPDSTFGKALKGHIRRIEGLTQLELSRESLVASETISRMVKGERVSGPKLRGNLRAIIKALHKKKALLTLDEANALMLTIPAVSILDERDPDDAEIIALFDSPATEVEQQVVSQSDEDHSEVDVQVSSDDLDDMFVLAPDIEIEPTIAPVPPVPMPIEPVARNTRRRLWWYGGAGLALLILVGLILGVAHQMFSNQTNTCSAHTNGVTLYTDINYQGQCYTFGPGEYELTKYGLEQNVSSIRDSNAAYHITLFDKAKNFYYLDKDSPILPAEWDKRADTIHIEKHRPTSCQPGSNGIIAFTNTDYAGGCLFITGNIPDLTPLNFDSDIVSIQFVGSYQNTQQLVIYNQPNYKGKCGVYWQNQSDLERCARLALSVQVLPFRPPTPIATVPGTHYAGDVAPQASLSPGSAGAVVDGNLQTEWIAGHMVGFELQWNFPVTVYHVVIWDRKQSTTDNNQINKLKLSFSDGTSTGNIDMISDGPRCADVTFPAKTITWLRIVPVDASGNNGYSEVQVWATTGTQYSNNTCVNKVMVAQTVPT